MEDKRLVRPWNNRMVAGVCAGVADYFNTDPTIIRLLFVGAHFVGLPLLVPYLIAWIVMPNGPS